MPTSLAPSLRGTRTPGPLNIVTFMLAPRGFLQFHRERYGRSYTVRGMRGDMVFTTDPEHIKRVFAADAEAFDTLSKVTLPELFGARSVIVTSGPTHRRQRKLLAPPLHGPRLRALAETMRSLATRHVDALKPGQTLRALDFTTAFTLEVIVRTVFGATSEREVAELSELVQAMIDTIPPVALFLPPLQASWFPPWKKFLAARARFRDWTRIKIDAARHANKPGTDVLSLLLEARYDDGSAMDDEEVRDQLASMLLAGHETTAVTLANCISRLALHPEGDTLRAELQREQDVLRAPYLSAFLDETLRLAPVVTDVVRIAKQEFALDDRITLQRNQAVVIAIEGVQIDADLYPDPLRFRPERFLERKYAPHEFLAFGGGSRRCIGAAFSDYESKLMLAELARRVTYTLTRGKADRRVRRNLTMGPQHGVPIRIEAVR